MIWLLDGEGRVKPEHAADYEVVGRPRPQPGTGTPGDDEMAERDRVDAFANRPPALV